MKSFFVIACILFGSAVFADALPKNSFINKGGYEHIFQENRPEYHHSVYILFKYMKSAEELKTIVDSFQDIPPTEGYLVSFRHKSERKLSTRFKPLFWNGPYENATGLELHVFTPENFYKQTPAVIEAIGGNVEESMGKGYYVGVERGKALLEDYGEADWFRFTIKIKKYQKRGE